MNSRRFFIAGPSPEIGSFDSEARYIVGQMTDPSLSCLLELRLKMRGRPEGKAIVDRALAIVARGERASPEVQRQLQAEIQQLQDELTLRFGLPRPVAPH